MNEPNQTLNHHDNGSVYLLATIAAIMALTYLLFAASSDHATKQPTSNLPQNHYTGLTTY